MLVTEEVQVLILVSSVPVVDGCLVRVNLFLSVVYVTVEVYCILTVLVELFGSHADFHCSKGDTIFSFARTVPQS